MQDPITRREQLKRFGSLAALAGIAGCSGSSGTAPGGSGEGTPDGTSTGTPIEETPTQTPAGKTISGMDWGGLDDPRKTLTGDFAERTDIEIDWQVVPISDFQTKLTSAIAAGRAPDLSASSVAWIPAFGKEGAVAELPEYDEPDRFTDAAYESVTHDGTMYAVPWFNDCRLQSINREKFDDAGLDYPDMNAYHSWDDFEQWAIALEEAGHTAMVIVPAGVDMWMMSNGGRYFDDDMTEATINAPEVVETLEFLKKHFDEGRITIGKDADDDWVAGTAAMANYVGSWHLGRFEELDIGWQYIHTPIGPSNESGVSHSWLAGKFFVLPKGAENEAAVREWFDFILSDEVQARSPGMFGGFPATNSALESERMDEFVEDHPKAEPIVEEMKNTVPLPGHPKLGKITDRVRTAYELVLQGDKSPQSALDAAAEDLDGML